MSSDRYARRTSSSGFEYPKDLYKTQYAQNFQSIYEGKCAGQLPLNMNGERKSEVANPNSFSETNINSPSRHQFFSQTVDNFDSIYNYNDSTSIPRFGSTPLIPQIFTQNPQNQINYSQLPPNCNKTYNPQMNSNFQIYSNGNPLSYYPSFYLCDSNGINHQDLVYYTPAMPSINSDVEDCEMYCNTFSNNPNIMDYQTGFNRPPQLLSDIEQSCFKCQLDMTPDFANNDLMFFLPQELHNEMDDINRVESQSMPSLHGDDDSESDLNATENDKHNTVHGDEMLKELKKMTSVFTDVVELPCHSRFKKTRIEERKTFWRVQRLTVKDYMVKVIPEEVLKVKQMDSDILDKLEIGIFGHLLMKQAETLKAIELESPQCLHSVCRCRSAPLDNRYRKHFHRGNRTYRNSFNSLSPHDLNTPFNISSRRSSQIPIRIPIVLNTLNSTLSPAIHNTNRMFFEPNNIRNGRNFRRTRRWSIGSSKFEKSPSTYGMRPQTLRQASEFKKPMQFDFSYDYLDNRLSYEFDHTDEYSTDYTSEIRANFESKLDKHLTAIKRSVMSYVESNLSEIKKERRWLYGTKIGLEKQLEFYKEKVQILENSVRQNLSEDKWELFGIVNNDSC